ncbi:MAG: DUF2586 family protein [Rikenellaceae bacterium]|nr:DUF2586 family protein [Rikenellaceae bacterium]
MGLPDVNINVVNGLEKTAEVDTSVSGLIAHATEIAEKMPLGVPFAITSLDELEAKGVNEAYDITGKVLLWHHVRDFYTTAAKGTMLYILPLASSVKMADMVDPAGSNISKLLTYAKGTITLLAVTAMAEKASTIVTNVGKAQQLYAWALARHMPLNIILEGASFPATYTEAPNIRQDGIANRVTVVISQDPDVAAKDAAFAGYAQPALYMGTLAANTVNRSPARVRSGALPVIKTAISNGKQEGTAGYYDDDQLGAIHDMGYVFMRTFIGKAGYYWSGDYTAVAATDDCDKVQKGRTLDKAIRIMYSVNVDELNDDVEIDTSTGRMMPEVIKAYQKRCEDAILEQMDDEISGVAVYVDETQDVLATDKLKAQLAIVGHGYTANIDLEIGFTKTLKS